MPYAPKTWTTGETITAAELQALENGLAAAASQLAPTATKTAAYTAAVGDLAVMNVAGGAATLTLPTAPANKAQVGFIAVGAASSAPLTVNRGGATDTLGPSGATSVTAVLANEVTVYQYDAPNTRWLAVGNVKPQTALDGRFLKTSDVSTSGTPTGDALKAAYVPKWQPSTAYTAGTPVLNPSGQIVTANATFTSSATYDSSKWTVVASGGGGGASLPTQTGQAGRYLSTDGTSPLWSPVPLVAGAYNLTASSMRNAKFAWGRADAPGSAASTSKTGSFHLAFFGDSNGLRPGGNNSYTISDRLKSLLDRDSLLYNGGLTPPAPIWFDNPTTITNSGTPPNFASVATITGTWAAAAKGPFESYGITSSTANSKIQWVQIATGTGSSNTCRVYYLQQTGGGNFTVTTTSNGSFPAQATAGATALKWVDFNGGDGGISITVDGTGPVTIFGREMHRQLNGTTTPVFGTTPIRADQQIGVKVSRFSVYGYTMEQLALDNGVASSLGFAFDFLKPDLAVVPLMTNDGNGQIAVSTYTASATSVAQRAKAAGCDVLFVGAPPYSSDATNTIKLSSYVAAIKTVCDANNTAYLDIPALWGDYTAAFAAGLMDNADGLGVHMSPAGVTAFSQAIYDCIRASV